MESTAIDINNISFSYDENVVLDDVTFKVSEKTLSALVGPNGGGKSTLIKCITGLLTPSNGTIEFSNKDAKRKIGYVEQRHFLTNDFPITVREVVSSGLVTTSRKWFRTTKADKELVEHAIESVGLKNKMNQRMDSLSGGQQQRVLIAKAFATEPDILILDEPTAGVDMESQTLFRDALEHIIEEHKTTVLLVSHELSAVADLVDKIIVLKNRIIFDGTPEELKSQGVSLGLHDHDLPMWLENVKQ